MVMLGKGFSRTWAFILLKRYCIEMTNYYDNKNDDGENVIPGVTGIRLKTVFLLRSLVIALRHLFLIL